MAIQGADGKPDAAGDAAATGMPKQPAPVRKVSDAGAYGQNRYAGRSSLNPGEQTDGKSHSLVSNPDPNLDTIIQRGAGRGDDVENWQRRNVDAAGKANVPDAFGSESARRRQPTASEPSGSLPAKPSFKMPALSENPGANPHEQMTDEQLQGAIEAVWRLLQASAWEWKTVKEYKTDNDHALVTYTELIREAASRGWLRYH